MIFLTVFEKVIILIIIRYFEDCRENQQEGVSAVFARKHWLLVFYFCLLPGQAAGAGGNGAAPPVDDGGTQVGQNELLDESLPGNNRGIG